MRVLKKDISEEVVTSSFRRMIESLDDSEKAIIGDPENFISNFLQRNNIRDAVRDSKTNKELIYGSEEKGRKFKGIKDSGATDLELKIFEKYMKDAEGEFDGNAIFNKRYFNGVKKQMKDQIAKLRESINSGSLSPIEKQNAQAQLLELSEQFNMINKAENLYQVTGRGYVNDELIKVAYDIRDLGKGFENIYQIIGRSGKKSEIGIAKGLNFIQMSGFGIPKPQVYADPVTLAFHPELFTSPADLDNITKYSAQVMQDFQNAIETNTLPQKVVRMMEQNLTEDISNMPDYLQMSKERNREFMRRILELHQSGIGPRSSPEMMNMLHSVFATEAFSMDITSTGAERFMPVMPGTQRFALASEALEALPGGGGGQRLIKGVEKMTMQLADGAEVTGELLKFRVNNHKMLFAPGMIPEFFNALGGFDLDDKGLFTIKSFTGEGGKRRLAFGITRQPSGVNEVIYGSAKLDDLNTIRSIFGANEKFMEFLEDTVNTSSNVSLAPGLRNDAEIFRALITGKIPEELIEAKAFGKSQLNEYLESIGGKKVNELTEEYVEDLVFRLYEATGQTISKMSEDTIKNIAVNGASALRNTDLYKRSQVYKLFKEEKAFDVSPISEEMLSIVDQYRGALGDSLSKQIKSILSKGKAGQAEFVQFMRNYQTNPAVQALSTHSIFNKMLASAGADGNFLGVYVNRSMVVGSTLNQLDDFVQRLYKINSLSAGKHAPAELKQLMKYGIGLLSSEEAIDSTINFGSSSFKLSGIGKSISAVSAILDSGEIGNAAAAQKAALKALGYDDASKVTLDLVGETAIKRLGMRLGSAAAISKSSKYAGKIEEELFLGIDEILLEDRLSNQDLTRLIEGIKTGLYETKKAGNLRGEKLDELQEALNNLGKDYNMQRSTILQFFGLNEKHRYASVSKFNEQAAKANMQFDIMRRLYLSGIGEDSALSALQISQEARRSAEFIVRKNIEDFSDIMSEDLKLLSESGKSENTLKKLRLGRIIQDEINEASKVSKVSVQEIINAVEKVGAEMAASSRTKRFDLSRLHYIPDDQDFLKQIGAARSSRQAAFYSSRYTQESTDAAREYLIRRDRIRQSLLSQGDVFSEQELSTKVLAEMIDESTGLSQEIRNIAAVMSEDKKKLKELGLSDLFKRR